VSEITRKNPRIFYGWWTVIVTGVAGGLSYGFYLLGLSVFFKDLAAELNLGRAATSVAAGIGRLEGGITSPIIGWLSDKIGPKWWIVSGIGIGASGFILMRYITEVWHYYLVWGVLSGIGLNVALTVAVDKALADWFVRRRGLAQGLRFGILSLFQFVALQMTTPMVLAHGWRMTCLIWGCILFAFVPLTYAVIKPGRPERYGWLPDGTRHDLSGVEDEQALVDMGTEYAAGHGEIEVTYGQAMKTLPYWMLVAALAIHNIITGGFTIHIIPFLTDKGIETSVASFLMGMMILFAVPTRFLGGITADRLRIDTLHYPLALAMFLHVVGLGSFLIFQNTVSMYILLACFGMAMGAATPLLILILGRYFGRKAYGSILGTTLAIFAPLALISPIYCGWVYDTSGSYDAVFINFVVLAALAVLILFFVRPPRKQERMA